MKEKEIASLLSEGNQAAELVRQGYARGTVYKVAQRLGHASTTPFVGTGGDASDWNVENDPDVIQLRKAIRMAELQRQLEEIEPSVELVDRITKLEEEVSWLRDGLQYLYGESEG